MEIEVWSFSKRVNSTKIPDTEGVKLSATFFKDTTDISNPVLKVATINVEANYNYCKCGARYYFIDKIEMMTNNIRIIYCNLDVLATYKSDILNTSVFVLRSTSKYNVFLADDMNKILSTTSRTILDSAEGDGFFESGEGCYILEVSNATINTQLAGFNGAYILTAEQMRQIAYYLMNDSGGIFSELEKIYSKPIDAIIRCTWLPLNYNNVCTQTGGVTSNLYLGAVQLTDIRAYIVGINNMEFSDVFDLRNYLPTGNYTRNGAYTQVFLTLPYVGVVSIDTSHFIENDDCTLRIRTAVNVREGKMLTIITTNNNQNAPISIFESIIGENRAISSANTNIDKSINNLIVGTAASISSGNVTPLLANAPSILSDAARSNISTVGSNGGSAFYALGSRNRVIILKRQTTYSPTDSNVRNTIGLPFNTVTKLSNISGYVQTYNASVSIAGLYSISAEINRLLDGGVYIE